MEEEEEEEKEEENTHWNKGQTDNVLFNHSEYQRR